MRQGLALLFTLIALAPARAQDGVRVELNTLETADNRCRMTFVIENKTSHAVDSLKLDFALFNAEGAVYRRMVEEMSPLPVTKHQLTVNIGSVIRVAAAFPRIRCVASSARCGLSAWMWKTNEQ